MNIPRIYISMCFLSMLYLSSLSHAMLCPRGTSFKAISKLVPFEKNLYHVYDDEFGAKRGVSFAGALNLNEPHWWMLVVGEFTPGLISIDAAKHMKDNLGDPMSPDPIGIAKNESLCVYQYTNEDGFKRYAFARSYLKESNPIPQYFLSEKSTPRDIFKKSTRYHPNPTKPNHGVFQNALKQLLHH